MVAKCLACIPIFFGVILLILGLVLPSFLMGVVDKALSNDGRGSIFRLCENGEANYGEDTNTKVYDSWRGRTNRIREMEDGADVGTFRDYYFFDIQNPRAYLEGTDTAEILEVGPIVIQTFGYGYDITWDADGNLSHKSVTSYIVRDKPTQIHNTDEVLFNYALPKLSPSHVTEQTRIKQFSPLYQGAMKTANEFALVLTAAGCTATQIGLSAPFAIDPMSTNPALKFNTCSGDQIGDDAAICACCMPDDVHDIMNGAYSGTYDTAIAADPDAEAILKCSFYTDMNHSNADPANPLQGPVTGIISMLGLYDSGTVIKSNGETMEAGPGVSAPGTPFDKTGFGDQHFRHLAIQDHSINDLLFGYPSAFISFLKAALAMEEAITGTVTALVTGGYPNTPDTFLTAIDMILDGRVADYPSVWGVQDPGTGKFSGNLADYTRKVKAVCKDTCAVEDFSTGVWVWDNPNTLLGETHGLAYQCHGQAISRTKEGDLNSLVDPSVYLNEPYASDESLLEVGGIDCMPYSYTYSTEYWCNMIEEKKTAWTAFVGPNPGQFATLELFLTTYGIEIESCQCAGASGVSGDDVYTDGGCCLKAGSLTGSPLMPGYGCLEKVAGFLEGNYAGGFNDKERSQEMAKAINDYEPDTLNMCPAAPYDEFSHIVLKEGLAENAIFIDVNAKWASVGFGLGAYTGGRLSPQHYDPGVAALADYVAVPDDIFVAPVKGSEGLYTNALGLTSSLGDESLSDGAPHSPNIDIYISQVKRHGGFTTDSAILKLTDNAGKNVEVHRYKLSSSLLASAANGGPADAAQKGSATVYDGLQDITFSNAGFCVYLSMVLFLGGDELLYTQEDNTHLMAGPGNGIKMYNSYTYGTYGTDVAAPAAYVVGGTNADYTMIDKAFVTANQESVEVYLDFEPATGIMVNGHERLQGNISPWICDPSVTAMDEAGVVGASSCGLKGYFAAPGTSGMCYKPIGDSLLDTGGTYEGIPPLMLGGTNPTNYPDGVEITYPCSAMNTFTPKYKGGKILPLYWADKRGGVEAGADMDTFDSLMKLNALMGVVFLAGVGVGAALLVLGVLCCMSGGAKTTPS